jgi:hypothetical protein
MAGSVLLMAAAVTHFCALEGYSSPFGSPRFGKIMGGIRRTYCKPVKSKKPYLTSHIMGFMDIARGGTLLDWRAALPMALCFQQLLCGAEAFDLDGGNVSVHAGYFLINVESSKNHPEGFDFKVTIDSNRPHCVGTFLADFILRMAIRLEELYFVLFIVKGGLEGGTDGQDFTFHDARKLQEIDFGIWFGH